MEVIHVHNKSSKKYRKHKEKKFLALSTKSPRKKSDQLSSNERLCPDNCLEIPFFTKRDEDVLKKWLMARLDRTRTGRTWNILPESTETMIN